MKKAIAPVIVILAIIAFVASIVAVLSVYTNVTGVKTVQKLCQNTVGQWVDCSLIPFTTYTNLGSVPAPASPEYLSIKELQVLMQDPQSESWTDEAGTLRLFTAGTDVKDPTATAFATVTIASGAGSQSSWNKASTDTKYVLVSDGAGTYYDKEWNPFYFLASKYNKALGTYTLTIDKTDAPPKVGTFTTFLVSGSNSTGTKVNSTTAIWVDDSVASGTFNFQFDIQNTGANTILKDVVLFFKSDVTNPMEGNEFSGVTLQKSTGSDFNLPSDVKSYVANEVPVPVTASLAGGASGRYTITFTYSSTNFQTGGVDKLYIGLDDLGGWLASDVLPANKGATAQAYSISRDVL